MFKNIDMSLQLELQPLIDLSFTLRKYFFIVDYFNGQLSISVICWFKLLKCEGGFAAFFDHLWRQMKSLSGFGLLVR